MQLLEKIRFNLRHHRRQRHPWRSLAADLAARTGLWRHLRFQHHGFSLRLRSHGLARELWADPGLGLDGEYFVSAFLKPGETMVDVGANIGVHALAASHAVGASGRVLALEPHPETYAAMLENLRDNRATNVTARQAAAGPQSGKVHLSNRVDDDWNHVSMEGGLEVAQATLDELCADWKRLDLLKVDIEGYELPCLQGATQVLARTSCVLVEYWHEHTRRFGYGWKDLAGFLGGFGFHAYQVTDSARGSRLVPASGEENAELRNFVFVRAGEASERLQRLTLTAAD